MKVKFIQNYAKLWGVIATKYTPSLKEICSQTSNLKHFSLFHKITQVSLTPLINNHLQIKNLKLSQNIKDFTAHCILFRLRKNNTWVWAKEVLPFLQYGNLEQVSSHLNIHQKCPFQSVCHHTKFGRSWSLIVCQLFNTNSSIVFFVRKIPHWGYLPWILILLNELV